MVSKIAILAQAAAIALVAGQAIAAPETYRFDPTGHTEIIFSYSHFGQSIAYGELDAYDGTIVLDSESPTASTVDVTIDAASIDSGVAVLDEHLKSADFLDVERYPTIHFVSTEVRPTGTDTAEIEGNLTIKDTTKPVTLSVKLNYKGKHALAQYAPVYDVDVAGFSARGKLKRSDFGVDMFAPGVGDELDLIIETELFKVAE